MQMVRTVGHTISGSVTRPSDTNAYTAGDVVANSTSAPTIIRFRRVTKEEGGYAKVQGAVCVTSANVAAAKPDLELWLFDTTITMDNDNAVFTPTDAELLTLVGVIAFPVASFKVGDATAGAGGNAICEVRGIKMPVSTVVGSNDLFGVVVVRNAYAPVSDEVITFRLKMAD